MNDTIIIHRHQVEEDYFEQLAEQFPSNLYEDTITLYLRDSQYTAINDIQLAEQLVEDLTDHYEHTEESAKDWIDEYGNEVVNDMWDAYGHYLEDFGQCTN